EALIRGCQEHFRAGVTRVSRISGAVPPNMTEYFVARAMALLDAPDTGEFLSRCALIIRDYPKLESWLSWWMRPGNASRLFESERAMDIDVWDSLPSTTNAEEAMHWKLYSGCGKDHNFLGGMRALHAAAVYYERLHHGATKGALIRYGQTEPWKVVANNIGRTKPTRAVKPDEKKRKANDGRPPDTAKELVHTKDKKRKANHHSPDTAKEPSAPLLGPASYPWSSNSCWLDTALQLLFAATSRSFDEFSQLFKLLPKGSGLRALYETLETQRAVDPKDASASQTLLKRREALRKILRNKRIIGGLATFESVFVWLSELARRESELPDSFRAGLYFQAVLIDIHHCSGSSKIGGPHVEISETPHLRGIHQVGLTMYKKHNGSLANYLKDYFSVDKSPIPSSSCWRFKDGISSCAGTRTDIKGLVISLPVVLAIEIGDESLHDDNIETQSWKYPSTITPHSKAAAEDDGLVYDLIGFALVNRAESHFTARYIFEDNIYTYDGMLHNGYPVQERDAKVSTHLSGKKIRLPEGYAIHQVFYHLRGGLRAQEKFFELRAKAYRDRFNIHPSQTTLDKPFTMSYPHPDFTLMDKKERFWIVNPYRSRTAEYLSRTRIASPLSQISLEFSPDPPESEEGVSENALDITDPSKHHITSLSILIRPGMGALARRGDFWYPVRLVKPIKSMEPSWMVRWWRECNFEIPTGETPTTVVAFKDIIDSLWLDRMGRRNVRLGKWRHACEVPTSEDILADPTSVPYTAEVDHALLANVDILKKLLNTPSELDDEVIPAKSWLEALNKNTSTTIVPHVGSLSIVERAQVANWFEVHISKTRKRRHEWIGRLPIAHAYTLFIASRLKQQPNLAEAILESGTGKSAWHRRASVARRA
ncbi:hypothetical protein FPV67DRAFT_1415419, partial [Lyophyllum atratum]